jgi:hypothetical protein
MTRGISDLDPRVAATDKYIQDRNIPPDQAERFLLSMGADPRYVSLVFKYRKLKEAAENSKQAPPSTTSVAQDISNQYQQLKQQERMQSGLAAMPAPALANASMQGGITGEPTANMAGGGIVAFAGRGPSLVRSGVDLLKRRPLLSAGVAAGVGGMYALGGNEPPPLSEATVEEEGPAELTPEEYKLIASMGMGTGASAQTNTPAPPARMAMPKPFVPQEADMSTIEGALTEAKARLPASRQAAMDEQMRREEQLGETAAIEARRKKITTEKEQATMSPEKMLWLAVARGGFAASASGARNLWDTLSKGGVASMDAYESMKQKQEDTLQKLSDKELQLDSMTAAIKRGAMAAGDKRYDDAAKEVRELQTTVAAQKIADMHARNTLGAQLYETQAANVRAANQEAGADRRAAMGYEYRKQALQLDRMIDEAIANSVNPKNTPEQRAAAKKLAAYLTAQRAAKERTESSYQLGAERTDAQYGFLNDGFSNVSEG